MSRDQSSAPDDATPAITPEMIERFRQTGIRLDRQGRFWHEGGEIQHQGLRRALLRWLDRRDEDGRIILRLDDTRYAYIDVEDAPLLVLSVRWDGDRAWLRLNDDSEEELAYGSLSIGEDDAVYCRARGGRLSARLTTPAYYTLTERIRPAGEAERTGDQGDAAEGFVLDAAGRSFAIAVHESADSCSPSAD
ncbi:DUF1285 domain-containing protein [Haliangium ochraceum]|uniref:DUF1285 domain-containing protein n=1 Tax=Haliangium ochraceum (strain DSM 14365 / JCM 11303 / SMP-2) TaxID=502025 RepID=D0LXN0_HALO1|nr:DUF1285 domain-containing protein [Haliangium ochraceum]ACY17785.1 hypothetical protein Hoch_5300 [Haliangium ochraceum DSM 14365]